MVADEEPKPTIVGQIEVTASMDVVKAADIAAAEQEQQDQQVEEDQP